MRIDLVTPLNNVLCTLDIEPVELLDADPEGLAWLDARLLEAQAAMEAEHAAQEAA